MGDTQDRNAVRKIGKYRNTVSKMDEIPIRCTAFMIGDAYLTLNPSRVLFYVKHVYTRNQPQPSREKREKILN